MICLSCHERSLDGKSAGTDIFIAQEKFLEKVRRQMRATGLEFFFDREESESKKRILEIHEDVTLIMTNLEALIRKSPLPLVTKDNARQMLFRCPLDTTREITQRLDSRIGKTLSRLKEQRGVCRTLTSC